MDEDTRWGGPQHGGTGPGYGPPPGQHPGYGPPPGPPSGYGPPPDDLAALVGSSTVLAVGGTADRPGIGVVSKTADTEKARQAASKALLALDEPSTVTARSTPDGAVLANSPEYADRLTATGTLGTKDQFKAALPDLADAQAAVYVDVRQAAQLAGEQLPDSARALRSFGLTAASSGDSSTVHLRLVVGD